MRSIKRTFCYCKFPMTKFFALNRPYWQLNDECYDNALVKDVWTFCCVLCSKIKFTFKSFSTPRSLKSTLNSNHLLPLAEEMSQYILPFPNGYRILIHIKGCKVVLRISLSLALFEGNQVDLSFALLAQCTDHCCKSAKN